MRSRRRRTGSAAALALVLVVAAAVVIAMRAGLIGDRTAASAATSTATAPPRFSTPTPSAPAALPVEPGPNQPVATDPTPSTVPTAGSSGGTARVQVVITYADANPDGGGIEVDGFVPGVVESNGRCTLRLTNGQRSAEVSGDAQPNASTTSCGALVVPADQVSAGTWGAVLSYASATSAGSSSLVDVVVP